MLNNMTKSIENLCGEIPDWLAPLSDIEPCGPNLEYDPEYMLLLAKIAPKGDAQYGDFVDTPEGPHWADIERDCHRLLLRTRDITLLTLLLRCRTRSAQATGLQEGLTMLVGFLEQYPDDVHPQLLIDGELDPTIRANALAALVDPDGLLSDIRDITLSKNSATRLQVRDVERAHTSPGATDTLSIEMVQHQLADLRHVRDATLVGLTQAYALVDRLSTWCHRNLPDHAPDLRPLIRLLALFASKPTQLIAESAESASPTLEDMANKLAYPTVHEACAEEKEELAFSQSRAGKNTDAINRQPNMPMNQADRSIHTIDGRQAALQAIRGAREWFEVAEPSSPVAILLRQAEKLVGRRFSEVAQCIPMDLLVQWEQD